MKKLSIICVIFLLAWLSGLLLAGCQQQPEVVPPEIGDGWSVYNGKDTGIRFYYPSEWGEVIDYADYFQKLTTKEEPEELSREEKERMEAFKSALKDSGKYLAFSNLDMDWATHIRITSVEKMQSFVSDTNKSFASLPETLQERSRVMYLPLFGFWGCCVLEQDPSLLEQLPQKIRDIAALPEGASPEDLRHTAQPVFILFANGIRYMADRPGSIGPLKTIYGQIATSDGKLSGVTEIGAEGFDVAARDYWDCILTTSDGDRLVYISFSLQLPHYSAWDNPVEWSEGATPPGMEELLDEQQTQFIKFARTITLLK